MPKYDIKPNDYTNCHPVIAEHLRRGEQILCLVWDANKLSETEDYTVAYVEHYAIKDDYPYRVGSCGFVHAEPIPMAVDSSKSAPTNSKVKMIMSLDRALPILVELGYKFGENGNLGKGLGTRLFSSNFKYFGGELEGAPSWFKDHPMIIEEV